MCLSHKISVHIAEKIFSCISLNLVQFSLRPILNPGPSQCVALLEIFFLSSNLTDIEIIILSVQINFHYFCPLYSLQPHSVVKLIFSGCWWGSHQEHNLQGPHGPSRAHNKPGAKFFFFMNLPGVAWADQDTVYTVNCNLY